MDGFGSVQSQLPPLPPVPSAAYFPLQLFYVFGSFYLPLHPFVTHVLPTVRPEKALLRPNPYTGSSLPGLDLRVQSHCPGTFLYMQMPTPRPLSLGWVSGGLSIRPQEGVDLILTHYAMKPNQATGSLASNVPARFCWAGPALIKQVSW